MNKEQLIQQIVDTYDVLLLDNDGTCFRTEELHAEIGAAILRANGVPDMTYEERFGMMGQGEHGIWELLHAQGRTPSISKDEFKKQQGELFVQALPTITPEKLWRPGMPELIKAFHDAGKPIIIVSNTARDIVEALHAAGGQRHLITEIIALEDIYAANKQRKPAGDAYLMGVERGKILAEKDSIKALAAEDTIVGLTAALAAAEIEDIDTLHIFYEGVGHKPHDLATFTVADHLDLCDAFKKAATGLVQTPNGPMPVQPGTAPTLEL